MDLVSVIVPVYNVEKYLEECVYSLIHQTYSELEIILVDDGSKDNSGAICDKLKAADHRIKVIHKQNAGLGYARNSGLDIAQGVYVTFIDSDDIAEKDLVENLINGIKTSDADTCIGGYKRVNTSGEVVFEEKYEETTYTGENVYGELFVKMLGSKPELHDSIRMSVWNVMYSMDIVKKYNLKFPSEREFISEDIIWDSEYYKYSKAVTVVNSTSYLYRVTPGSLTQKYRKDKFELICKLYSEVQKRISNEANYDEAIIRLQKQFFVNLRSCISQEAISGKNVFKIRKSIKDICETELVLNILNSYPIGKINFKAKVFLYLIKAKCYFLISILSICKLV